MASLLRSFRPAPFHSQSRGAEHRFLLMKGRVIKSSLRSRARHVAAEGLSTLESS
ncbi:hypothetical protein GCWU000341_02624 [Oribacterium sp. oral taxon 078 str. F0262]|nr:hypothetical protein GCWU000341_02624 [Oribacterium sp. oral taxon 078 str. F0262]